MSEESIFEEAPELEGAVDAALPYSWKHMAAGSTACLILAIISTLLIGQFIGSRPHDLRAISMNARDTVSGFLINHRIPTNAISTTELALEKTHQAHFYTFDMDVSVPPSLNKEELAVTLEKYLRAQKITVSTASTNNQALALGYGGTDFAQIRFASVATPLKSTSATSKAAISPVLSETHVSLPPLPKATEKLPTQPPEEKAVEATTATPQKTEGWAPPSRRVAEQSASAKDSTPEPPVKMAKADTASLVPDTPTRRARLAIIVDDGGYGREVTDLILSLDNALTLSILPNTPIGTQTARRAKDLGFEIMLHMPMENMTDGLRHDGQLNVTMDESEIRRLTRDALDQVPGAQGVNNHTGSRYTTDPRALALFLDAVKQESLYFVDSRTTADSRALDMAQAFGIPAEKRDLFLDHDNDIDMIRMRFNEMIKLALANGTAVAICHFRPNTAIVLAEMMPELEKQGIELVPASQLVQ